MNWQPIETAPKDGTAFIGFNGHLVFRTWMQDYYVKWPHEDGGPTYAGEWTYENTSSYTPWSPTGWMPLPDLPK